MPAARDMSQPILAVGVPLACSVGHRPGQDCVRVPVFGRLRAGGVLLSLVALSCRFLSEGFLCSPLISNQGYSLCRWSIRYA